MTGHSHEDESSRLRILTAAQELIAESGYHGTTIAKVTERSGLPASSIYWFFKDKDELVREVVRHSIDAWVSEQPAWEDAPRDLPAVEVLASVLTASMQKMVEAPPFLRIGLLLLLEQYAEPPAARELFLELRDRTEAGLAAIVERHLEPDRLAREPHLPVDLARVLLASGDGLFLASQIDDDWDPVAAVPVVVRAALAAAGLPG